jgi:excisionase family DNA binding protein
MNDMLLNDRQRLGFFNVNEACKLLNLKYQTIRQNIRRGDIPRPSHLIGRRYYYSASEIDKMAEVFGKRQRYKQYQEQ